MPVVHSRSRVAAPIDVTFAFFDDPGNLAVLTPPPISIRPIRVDPSPPRVGSVIEFRYGLGPLQRSWLVRVVEHLPGERIVDETLSGPMARFHYTHSFRPATDGGSWVEDRIDFHVGPNGIHGAILDLIAATAMRLAFIWRRRRQRRLLGRPVPVR